MKTTVSITSKIQLHGEIGGIGTKKKGKTHLLCHVHPELNRSLHKFLLLLTQAAGSLQHSEKGPERGSSPSWIALEWSNRWKKHPGCISYIAGMSSGATKVDRASPSNPFSAAILLAI